jgi:hypothetical protein
LQKKDFAHVPDDPGHDRYRPKCFQFGSDFQMARVHFLIGHTSTEAVSFDQPVLVMLPETIRPTVVPTYAGQLQVGVKALISLGSEENIFRTHFLPYMGAVDENTLAGKKGELKILQAEIDEFSGDALKRAGVFVTYLSANHLIDRKLYPAVEKLRRELPLTNKDLTPLIDAVYASLRKSAGATSAHKQKIRAYIESGQYDSSLIDWLTRIVDPGFGLFVKTVRLAREVQELENRSRLTADPALERDFRTVVEEVAAGKSTNREVRGVNVECWLADIVGCKVQPRFFAEIREIRESLTKTGCLRLESFKNVSQLKEPAPKFIPLDKFSCIVTAMDRALSMLVMEYAHADPDMRRLFEGHVVHSGLLIRAFLGEADAIRTLYPKHVVGIPGKPELDETLISKARHAFEIGLMARLCSEHYGLEEHTLRGGIEKAVSIQQKILPLLPFEIHHFVDVLETRIRLRKMVEKLQASGSQSIDQGQIRTLRANLNAQNVRGQQITKRLNAAFRIDLSKMFCLDEPLIDEIEDLFGSELGFLQTVLARYIERGQTENDSGSILKQNNEAQHN